jgi:hypothetical protein
MPPRNLSYYPRSVTRLIDAIRAAMAEHCDSTVVAGAWIDFTDGRKEAVWIGHPNERPAVQSAGRVRNAA